MSAAFVPLDPEENNSSQPSRAFHKGMYREQYLHAATATPWGSFGSACGKSVLVAGGEERREIRPVLCDCWACALCGPRRAAWLKRELAAAQERYGLGYFSTLTIGTRTCSPAESDALITTAWDKLAQRITRKYGRFSYVWIREHTKKGMAHLHLLMSVAVDLSWLSEAWMECTGGSWIVDVQPVESSRAGDYVAKYCTQQGRDRARPEFEHLRGRRFFSKSRDVQFAPFRGDPPRVEVLDQETGEITATSRYSRLDVPYWAYREHLVKAGMSPIVERRLGVPFTILERRPELEQAEKERSYLEEIASIISGPPAQAP